MNYELIGYIASVLVAISLTMSSILRLRIINLVGATLFTVYGTVIGSVPVAGVNAFIVCINIFYLIRIFRTREFFRLLEVEPDSQYLAWFLEHNERDIRRFMPDYRPPQRPDIAVFVLRDVIPAGVMLGTVHGETLRIDLDYVMRDYRDFKVGEFIYGRQAAFFSRRGVRRFETRALTSVHASYLQRMGFEQDPRDASRYVREVAA